MLIFIDFTWFVLCIYKCMIEFGEVGCFFVRKKNGRLRIIFDTRWSNGAFESPPHLRLPTASTLGHIECGDTPLYSASGDIDNAFYRLAIPSWLSQEFRLPGIRARWLPREATAAIPDCKASSWIVPCLRILPMGWYWAPFFCQSFLE